MSRIYSSATRVFVWLGEPDATLRTPIGESRALEITMDAAITAPVNLPLRLLLDVMKKTKPSWWHRVWVVQEYAKAQRKPTVVYGPCQIGWSTIQMMAEAFSYSSQVTGFPEVSEDA